MYPSDQSRTGWERGVVRRGFRWENVMARDNLEDLGVGGRITLDWILKESVGRAWAELTWLRIVASVVLFHCYLGFTNSRQDFNSICNWVHAEAKAVCSSNGQNIIRDSKECTCVRACLI
jgi:hypothetical protein